MSVGIRGSRVASGGGLSYGYTPMRLWDAGVRAGIEKRARIIHAPWWVRRLRALALGVRRRCRSVGCRG